MKYLSCVKPQMIDGHGSWSLINACLISDKTEKVKHNRSLVIRKIDYSPTTSIK